MLTSSILIIAVSIVLLVYWFRYTCILLVRNAAASPAEAPSRFSFGEVQTRLKSGDALDPLEVSLQKDYDLLVYLLEHAAGLEMQSIEDRLLVWDYKVMRSFYRLTRIAAPDHARRALTEMASVIGILAGKLGERAGVQTLA